MKNARNVILLGSTTIVMILLMGYLLVVSPLFTKMQSGKVEYQEAQDSLSQAQTTAKGLEIYRTQESQVSDINTKLAAQFPTTADISNLNAQIAKAATSAGLFPSDVSSISTTTPTVVVSTAPAAQPTAGAATPSDGTTAAAATPAAPKAAPIASMEVSIAATGSLGSLVAFAGALGDIDRVLLITDVSISNESSKGSQISIKAIAYLYEPIKPVDTAPTPTATDSPTAAPTATPTPNKTGN